MPGGRSGPGRAGHANAALLRRDRGHRPLRRPDHPHRTHLPDVELCTPEEREFTTTDGTVVHGWLLRAPSAPQPGPLLLDVHGGPHLAWGPNTELANPYHQLLVAQGWSVLLLNPRGSDGYGEACYTANLHQWGHGDERDLLDPLDQLVLKQTRFEVAGADGCQP